MQPARNIASTSGLSSDFGLPSDSGCRVNGVDLGTMNRRVVLRSLAPYVRPYRLGLALALLFKFLLVPLGLVPAFLFRAFVDEVLVGGRIGFFVPLLAGYIAAFGLETLLHTLSARQANRVYNRVALDVRRLIWSSYLAAPDDVPSASAGEKRTVVDEDVERIESFLNGHVTETGFQATRAVVTAVVIMIISWQLALISLALGAASFGLARLLSRRMRANAEVRWPRYYQYVDWLHERIQGMAGAPHDGGGGAPEAGVSRAEQGADVLSRRPGAGELRPTGSCGDQGQPRHARCNLLRRRAVRARRSDVGRGAPGVSPPLYQSDRGDADAGGNHGANSGLVPRSPARDPAPARPARRAPTAGRAREIRRAPAS